MNSALLRELDRLRTVGDPASARAEIVRMFEAVRAAAYEDAARVCDRISKERDDEAERINPVSLYPTEFVCGESSGAEDCATAIRERAKEVGE